MKRKIVIGAVLLVAIILTGHGLCATTLADDSIVRLHVVANSDSAADQAVKLEIRDAVLAELDGKLEGCHDRTGAEEVLVREMDNLEALAEARLNAAGFTYGAHVSLADAEFPTKMYGNQVYPAGLYRALRVELGKAEGKNWWCVLFPPLCFVDINKNIAVVETRESALSAADGLESERLQFRSKLLDTLLGDDSSKPN